MIWRGEQYQRAVGIFYRKFGRFPTSVDDLLKSQNGGPRCLREAYKDPMNKEDGSWRFIYVTPTGQLIGSVQYTSLQQMAFVDQQRKLGITSGSATLTGAPTGNSSGDNSTDGLVSQGAALGSGGVGPTPGSPLAQALQTLLQGQNGQSPTPNAPNTPNGSPTNGQQTTPSFFDQGALTGSTGPTGGMNISESSTPQTDDSGQVMGGFIIGVASKIAKSSIKVYKGGTTYKQWEFIFNPLEQVQTISGGSIGPSVPGSQQPTNPLGLPQQPPQQPQIPQQPQ
ncbi:MAG TPA: hypothetical protein VGR81_01600 [Candidatus Acidoferrales bacterium]|nr:hypothetical protein [Candidatus Acidoferrales bacterium]